MKTFTRKKNESKILSIFPPHVIIKTYYNCLAECVTSCDNFFVSRQWYLGLVDNAPCRLFEKVNSEEDKMTQLHEQLKTNQER